MKEESRKTVKYHSVHHLSQSTILGELREREENQEGGGKEEREGEENAS
ncbi:MAG: hypothetical protein QXM53_10360 [Thermofilaceae archaeon]